MAMVMLMLLAVNPVPVVVLDPALVGGATAGQGSLIVEEVARALPPVAFKVTTSSQLAAVLGLERQRQLLGCGEEATSCVAEIASALGAEVVSQSTLAKVGSGFRCNLALISGRDGTTLERIAVDAADEGALLVAVREEVLAAAARVLGTLRPGHDLSPGRPGVRRHAWIPLVGGVALAASSGVLFGVTAGTWSNLSTNQMTEAEARALAESGRTTQTVAWVLGGVGGAALLAAGAMLAFGAPTEPRLIVAPVVGGGAAGVVLTGVLP